VSRYPHLGFDPAPGDTHAVRELHRTLTRCGQTLAETRGVITKLMDGATWKGDAAVAFRDRLENGPLPLDLKNAAHSFRKAARQLERWETDLTDFQRRAAHLNARAADAHHALTQARRRADHAADDPDLHTSGHRRTQAERALHHLTGAATDAQADLDHLLTQAHHLAEEHKAQAARRAKAIRNATFKLAPHEPGAFDDLIEWTKDNLPDVLSTLSALVGLAALVILAVGTGGAALPALFLVGALLSAGAVIGRMADPVVRASLWNGFSKGQVDGEFWGNLVSVLGDGVGALPGAGAVGRGSLLGIKEVVESEEVLTIGQRLAKVGASSWDEVKVVHSAESRTLLGAVVKPAYTKAADFSVAGLGVATGGIGLASTECDALDNDGVAATTTGADGLTLIGVDSGEVLGYVRTIFR
jgi:hypothetical protein